MTPSTIQIARVLALCSTIATASLALAEIRIENGLHFEDGHFLLSGEGIVTTTLPDQYYTKVFALDESGSVLQEWEFTDIIGHVVRAFGDRRGRLSRFLLSGRTTAGGEPESRVYRLAKGKPELVWDTAIFGQEYDGADFSVSAEGEMWAASWCFLDRGRVVVGEIGSYGASAEWLIESDDFDNHRPLDPENEGVVFLQSEIDSIELIAQCEGRLAFLKNGEEPRQIHLPDDVSDLGGLSYQPDTGLLWGNRGYPDGWLGLRIEDHRKQPNKELKPIRINGVELGIGPIQELRDFLPGGRLVARVQRDGEDTIYYLKVTAARVTARLVRKVPRGVHSIQGGFYLEPTGYALDGIQITSFRVGRLERSPNSLELSWDFDEDGRPSASESVEPPD